MFAAFFNKILKQLDMEPLSAPIVVGSINSTPNARNRRELRGNHMYPVVDRGLLDSWMSSYIEARAGVAAKCVHVVQTYEDQVQKYGYSLKHLHNGSKLTPKIREFLQSDDAM